MNEVVSVIVPVYKVEAYLGKCIESIINQTYKHLEIILVNDGSPDQCGKICDEYALKDERINVIHKANGGLSDARNAGLESAAGQYISFIDSDDYMDPRMIEVLLRNLKNADADLSVCGFRKVYSDVETDGTERESMPKVAEFSNFEAISNLFNERYYVQTVVAWNKLYKQELFDDVRYPVGKIHEDEYTTYKLVYRAERIVYTDEKLYNYLQRENSIMGVGFNKKDFKPWTRFQKGPIFFKQTGQHALYVQSAYSYFTRMMEYYNSLRLHEKDDNKTCEELLDRYRKEYRKLGVVQYLSLKKKMNAFLFFIDPRLRNFCKRVEVRSFIKS